MIDELFRLFYVMNDKSDDSNVAKAPTIDDWYYEVVGKSNETELPPMTSMTCWTSIRQLQEALRIAFRVPYNLDRGNESSLHTWAIRAVQFLQEQQLMWSNSSVATTEGVRVTATSRYDSSETGLKHGLGSLNSRYRLSHIAAMYLDASALLHQL